MKINNFEDKKIKINQLSEEDFKNYQKKIWNFSISLIKENAPILISNKESLREEIKRIKDELKKTKEHKAVFLVAEHKNRLVGIADIVLLGDRQEHIGMLGISVHKKYRGIGLGSYLLKKVIKLAKQELKPKPKIIRISVFSTNKPAIGLYRKSGFKKVAVIPKQIQFQGKLVDEIVMLLEL